MQDDLAIADNGAHHRYEIMLDGEAAARIEYRLRADGIELIHTEVMPDYEGRGLASRIAAFALDDARRRGLKVIPTCTYVAKYIERHPQYQDLVAQR